MQEVADRNLALRNLKSQVQQLNAEFHSVRDQVLQAEAQLIEVQESTYTAKQDAERARNEVWSFLQVWVRHIPPPAHSSCQAVNAGSVDWLCRTACFLHVRDAVAVPLGV